ncbi:MAG: alpha/beta hydrolase [Paracoccus sp. (in: a-proteobacteria)]|nr:alpha/beta hydrolase [Paracoccus sp. (in: a-proteobacteria)]
MFSNFECVDLRLGPASIHARIGGEGPALLLLHGYPQTHVMWHALADTLARHYRVVVADLRGHGDSLAHDGDFTFRAMAADQVALMRALDMPRFHLAAHDRGARTAHRMALDHPHAVASVALLDILATPDVWRLMDAWLARRYYHWLFLSQPRAKTPRMRIYRLATETTGRSGRAVFCREISRGSPAGTGAAPPP